MPEDRQQFFFGGRNPSGLTNILLLLIVIGVIIIILLLLWRYWWWHGVSIIGGAGGKRVIETSGGGNIVINAACCPGGQTTPTDCPKPEEGCESKCKKQYGSNPTMYSECIRMQCKPGGDDCKKKCWTRYSTAGQKVYEDCVKRECEKPEDSCEKDCRQRYGTTAYYPQCVQAECQPQPTSQEPDCRDSDGYNLATAGQVVSGDQTHSDECYSETEVTEWTCDGGKPKERREPCEGRCDHGRCVPPTGSCTDSDAGRDAMRRGTVTYISNQPTQICQDTCASPNAVRECYCKGTGYTTEDIQCPYGCVDGQCATGKTTTAVP